MALVTFVTGVILAVGINVIFTAGIILKVVFFVWFVLSSISDGSSTESGVNILFVYAGGIV